jgi:hypothetical protein
VAKIKLLMISRKVLEAHASGKDGDTVYRRLAGIHRRGVHLLITVAAPDAWKPTRGDADSDLALQGKIQEAIWEAGGEMDGVYYVRRSFFTQDRNRTGALNDILSRYHVKASKAALISSSTAFLKAATGLGINCHQIDQDPSPEKPLEKLLDCVL